MTVASASPPVVPAAPGAAGIELLAPSDGEFAEILTPQALAFLAHLARSFESRRQGLLQARGTLQRELDMGRLPDFPADRRRVRTERWTGPSIPDDLTDRRVEITGPVDRKMGINALNSGAQVYMADFEDACSPSWENLIDGQINLKDRWAGKIGFVDPQTKKSTKLNHKLAVLLVRPAGR